MRLVGLDGELLEEVKVSIRPAAIEKYLRSWPRLRVVLESGGQTNWICRLIAGLGHEVLVAGARQLRLISQSHAKNGRNDACWLAELGRANTALLAPAEPRTILEPMARAIAALTREINKLDRRIEKLGKEQCPATQLLRTADGVGPLTSLACVLELNNDVGRVKRSRRMGAVAGCRPKQRESGESSPELGVTKAGNGQLRRLVQSSQRILGPFCLESDLRSWGLQLAARGKRRAKRRSG